LLEVPAFVRARYAQPIGIEHYFVMLANQDESGHWLVAVEIPVKHQRSGYFEMKA
jgi:hypothetical protein